MVKRFFLFFAFFLFMLNGFKSSAEEADLSWMAKDKKPIRVFVKGFVNESGEAQILPEDFKKDFEEALINRRSVRFDLAQNFEASDIQISGAIKKYRYLEKDPVTISPGVGTLLLDAVTTENYVEMEIEFTVTDTKTSKILWNKPTTSYIKRMMTPKESIPLIYDKVSRTFLWKCFGKGR